MVVSAPALTVGELLTTSRDSFLQDMTSNTTRSKKAAPWNQSFDFISKQFKWCSETCSQEGGKATLLKIENILNICRQRSVEQQIPQPFQQR
jgi:hypothetical protein